MIIGLSGAPRSGKDSIAEILVQEFSGWYRIAFADRLRECVLALDPYVGYGEVRIAGLVEEIGWDAAKEAFPEVRRLLRYMGTEVVRDLIEPNYWVDYAMQEIRHWRNAVVTDVRFWNEAEAIKKESGFVVEVIRPGTEISEHRSDNDLADWSFDYTLRNDRDIKGLSRSVNEMFNALAKR